jgi:hypothetical protein
MPPNTENENARRDAASNAGGNRTWSFALAGLTALVIAALAVFAVVSTTGSGGSGSKTGNFTPNDQGLLQPGSKAPSFSAEGVDGTKVSLSPKGSEPTLLVFFAS